MNFRKTQFSKKLNCDFGGICTPDLCCSFMTDKQQSYSVSPDWNLKPETLSFVYNGQPIELLSQRWLSGLLEHNQHIYVSRLHIYFAVDHHTKSKSISIQILKPSRFRPPYTKKTIPNPTQKWSQVWSPTLKSSQYRPRRQKTSQSRCSH